MVNIKIALDAMGGDLAPESVIVGADYALSKLLLPEHNVNFSIYGQEDKVLPILSSYKRVKDNSVFINTPDVVLSNDKPSFALRHRRSSSMYHAINDIKKNVVNGTVSCGNTGALMAISRYLLGTLPDIYRPAIVTSFPSRHNDFALLDLGANVECNADSLFQFAIMGNAFAKAVLSIDNPRVALLNIGTEEVKGTDTIREAFSLIKKNGSSINFYGYIEANEMLNGNIDVVVADGFTGNIALKTCESTFGAFSYIVKESISHSLLTKFAGLLLKSALKKRLGHFDPRLKSGAMLLGLNGIVVKSHGNSDYIAFAHAILVAVNAIYHNINAKISHELNKAV